MARTILRFVPRGSALCPERRGIQHRVQGSAPSKRAFAILGALMLQNAKIAAIYAVAVASFGIWVWRARRDYARVRDRRHKL